MKITGISLSVFNGKAKIFSNESTNHQNPFTTIKVNNPFAGGISKDIFQTSSIDNTKVNIFAKKAAELLTSWNKGVEAFKNHAREFFAPAISFAGNIKAGYDKLNNINMEDVVTNFKKEIALLSLNKDVRKYVKMPIANLRIELAKELA